MTNVKPLNFSQLITPQSLTSKAKRVLFFNKVKEGWKEKKLCVHAQDKGLEEYIPEP